MPTNRQAVKFTDSKSAKFRNPTFGFNWDSDDSKTDSDADNTTDESIENINEAIDNNEDNISEENIYQDYTIEQLQSELNDENSKWFGYFRKDTNKIDSIQNEIKKRHDDNLKAYQQFKNDNNSVPVSIIMDDKLIKDEEFIELRDNIKTLLLMGGTKTSDMYKLNNFADQVVKKVGASWCIARAAYPSAATTAKPHVRVADPNLLPG